MNFSADQVEQELRNRFFRAMQQLAGGVCAVTFGKGERRRGIVATSVTSLSADPPSVLFCINRGSSGWPLLCEQTHFAVNILAAEQAELARRFSGASGEQGDARFEGTPWNEVNAGAPIIEGSAVSLVCTIEEILERHTHAVVIGRVRDTTLANSDLPVLTYLRGQYAAFGPSASTLRMARRRQ